MEFDLQSTPDMSELYDHDKLKESMNTKSVKRVSKIMKFTFDIQNILQDNSLCVDTLADAIEQLDRQNWFAFLRGQQMISLHNLILIEQEIDVKFNLSVDQ